MDAKEFRRWLESTFQNTFPFLLPVDEDHAMLHLSNGTQKLLPSQNHPFALASARNELSIEENDDLTIAIHRALWPNLDHSCIGDLSEIYERRKPS